MIIPKACDNLVLFWMRTFYTMLVLSVRRDVLITKPYVEDAYLKFKRDSFINPLILGEGGHY